MRSAETYLRPLQLVDLMLSFDIDQVELMIQAIANKLQLKSKMMF